MTPARLLSMWRTLAPHPGGRWLFSRLLGWFVPYSGSLGATVESLEPGHVVLHLRDRRAVRNHLGSVHAVALANLAELSSGLAMLSAAGPTTRGIVTALHVEFLRKARGPLRAEGHATPPPAASTVDTEATATITDRDGAVVATATIAWRLGPG